MYLSERNALRCRFFSSLRVTLQGRGPARPRRSRLRTFHVAGRGACSWRGSSSSRCAIARTGDLEGRRREEREARRRARPGPAPIEKRRPFKLGFRAPGGEVQKDGSGTTSRWSRSRRAKRPPIDAGPTSGTSSCGEGKSWKSRRRDGRRHVAGDASPHAPSTPTPRFSPGPPNLRGGAGHLLLATPTHERTATPSGALRKRPAGCSRIV